MLNLFHLFQGIYLDITYGGMTFDTLGMGQVPLYVLIIMLLVDFVLYGLLAIYFDNVIPGETMCTLYLCGHVRLCVHTQCICVVM